MEGDAINNGDLGDGTDTGQPSDNSDVASKFGDDLDAWKNGYNNVQSLVGKQGQTIGAQNQKISELESVIALITKGLQSASTDQQQVPSQQKQADLDYDARISDIAQNVEKGDIGLAEGFVQVAALTHEKATKEAMGQYNSLMEKQAQQSIENKFIEDNPGFEEARRNGALDAVKKTLPGLHDDFSAYFALQAQQKEAEFQRYKQEQAIKAGAENAGKLGGGAAADIPTPEKVDNQKAPTPSVNFRSMAQGMFGALTKLRGQ